MKTSLPLLLSIALLSGCASTSDLERARALGQAVDPDHPFAESAFVESQDLRLHYRHWVPSGVPVGRIVLIHGFGSSTFSFRFLVPPLLERGWEVAAVDVPPFGYSDKAAEKLRLPTDRGRLLWAVPEALGWRDPVVLLGHSMGGLYATAMTEARPGAARALILLAGAVPTDGKAPAGAPFFAGLLGGFLEGSLHSWASVKSQLEGFAGKGVDIPDAMVDGYAAPYQVPGGVKGLLAWSQAGGQAPVHPERLRLPVLLVWGEKDNTVPPKTGRELNRLIPSSRLVLLPGLGHLAHELQPDQVNAVVVSFLGDLPASP